MSLIKSGGCRAVLKDDKNHSVTINFPHDDDPIIVKKNWEKRVGRIDYNKLVLICDDQGLSEDDYKKFDEVVAYKKVLLTADIKHEKKYDWCQFLDIYVGQKQVGTYNGKTLKGGWLFEYIWDYVTFLNE